MDNIQALHKLRLKTKNGYMNNLKNSTIPEEQLISFHQKMAELRARRKPVRKLEWKGVYDETYHRAMSVMNAAEGLEVTLNGSAILHISD